ncbi:ubiquitin-conjugating enzyme [Bisporella sp. PMI_857]|nr:ubiquitin-conjugating enzyme [Bisporella sp. PMI_857]
MATSVAPKRLAKELSKIHGTLPDGITLVHADLDNLDKPWMIDIQVLDPNPLYMNQTFRLQFVFSHRYPLEPPEVTFVRSSTRPIPMHPHIYSNGIICLDLLGSEGWSPVQNVQSIAMSIQSMLTGNSKNERPEGDASFVASNTRRPRDIRFDYHDDNC